MQGPCLHTVILRRSRRIPLFEKYIQYQWDSSPAIRRGQNDRVRARPSMSYLQQK